MFIFLINKFLNYFWADRHLNTYAPSCGVIYSQYLVNSNMEHESLNFPRFIKHPYLLIVSVSDSEVFSVDHNKKRALLAFH